MAMHCRSCGGLLHVGLGPHVCDAVIDTEKLRRRSEQWTRTTASASQAGEAMRRLMEALITTGAVPEQREPIRVVATAGRAIDCQVSGCEMHGQQRKGAISR